MNDDKSDLASSKNDAIIDALEAVLLDAGYPVYHIGQLRETTPEHELVPLLKFLVRHWRANAPREG